MKNKMLLGILALSLAACAGAEGKSGRQGVAGLPGTNGPEGKYGADGTAGTNGTSGSNGSNGNNGTDGSAGLSLATDPLSSLVSITIPRSNYAFAASSIAEFVKYRVGQVASNTLPSDVEFPLRQSSTDQLRLTTGLQANVVVSWLDPLSWKTRANDPRFGANTDFTAFFGDGWTGTPYYNGADNAGYIFTNHEYISGNMPTLESKPTGQMYTFAKFLRMNGLLTNDINAAGWDQLDINLFIEYYKAQIGGSYMRVIQDPATGQWQLDHSGAKNIRYDATSNTRFAMTGVYGQYMQTNSIYDHSDGNVAALLPASVVAGTLANCSGGVTPWGTIISAEENTQDYYGDPESWWSSTNKLVSGQGADANASIVRPTAGAAGADFMNHSFNGQHHRRDFYGWLAEIDPGVNAAETRDSLTPGTGHAKLGSLGRARWENISFVLGTDWQPIPDQKLVAYYGDDRRNGRVYKFVSTANYTTSMTRAQKRALLDAGKVYVAHLKGLKNTDGFTLISTSAAPVEADSAQGDWVEMSLNSTSVAPNAAAFAAGTTAGTALRSNTWNKMGGFATQADVIAALHSAATKLGVFELNRPEDVEWNPGNKMLYVALTNHTGVPTLTSAGVVTTSTTARADKVGRIWAFQEADQNDPSLSSTFTFWQVWGGSTSTSNSYAAANPDNLLIDADFDVWFGTDGNFNTSASNSKGYSDALYYLDLDLAHSANGADGIAASGDEPAVVTFGSAFRFAATPSDAEATGPAFSSGMSSLFFGVQHPGEGIYSTWPQGRN